jgi:hypothetical protein
LRKRLDLKRCVVCGNPSVGFTGYVYYESGTTRLYAPFCKEHLDNAPKYANPIFENPAAVELFKQMFPVTYLQDVKEKPTLFFDSHKTAKED